MKTKGNYKSQYNDRKCRWCTTELENHIMTKCPQFKDLTKHIDYNNIMEKDSENLKYEATQINHIMTRIQKNKKLKIKKNKNQDQRVKPIFK